MSVGAAECPDAAHQAAPPGESTVRTAGVWTDPAVRGDNGIDKTTEGMSVWNLSGLYGFKVGHYVLFVFRVKGQQDLIICS